jgi:rubrerythrin
MVARKTMKMEIDIPENVITEAVVRAWKSSFRAPEYSHGQGGEGYEAILAQVKEQVMSLATSEEIRSAIKSTAAQLSPQIIRQAVAEELKKQVKRIVKEEKNSNTLFSSNDQPD